jgi:hypothetical protein
MSRPNPAGNLAPSRESKYRRPRRPFSSWALLIGILFGLGGGLYYAWEINPRIEIETNPWQLRPADKDQYMAGIALQYAFDGDLGLAVNRLLEMRLGGDPIQGMADAACRLATSSYVDNSSGLRAVRAMMNLYQLQGRSSCADNLIPAAENPAGIVITIEAGTPTLPPPATKTPTLEPANPVTNTPPAPIVVPTVQPRTNYVLVDVRTFCSAELSGIIEVRVQDFNGDGIPGEAVRVRWDGGESIFFTGLKPERGPDYADFQMEAGIGYTVEVRGQSDPSQVLDGRPCLTETSQEALISYRVFFRAQ